MVRIAGGIEIPTEWAKKKTILEMNEAQGIKLNERMLRKCIQIFNQAYDNRNNREYVVHSCTLGYKITTDTEEIKRSITDNDRRAITMLQQTRKVRNLLGMKDQISMINDL